MKLEAGKKLITCITSRGKAPDIVRKLYEEKGINTADIHAGRGGGRRGRLEVDVLTVVVDMDRADEIFEYIYYEANIGEYHGGFMYQGSLTGAMSFLLPEIPEED